MIKQIQEKYIILAIIIGLPGPFLFAILGQIFFPPVYTAEFPIYSPGSILITELGLTFLLFGSTVMGLKLEDEKNILPAAGFTMLAISAGVTMSSLYEITQVSTIEAYEKYYFITISSNFLYLPAMLLIASYNSFKWWIRLLGIISCFPPLISSIQFIFNNRNFIMLDWVTNTGYLLLGITQCLWAISVYINYRKKKMQ